MRNIIVSELIDRAKTCPLDSIVRSLKMEGAYKNETSVSIFIKTELKMLDEDGIDVANAEFIGTVESIKELISLVPDFSDFFKANDSIALILNHS